MIAGTALGFIVLWAFVLVDIDDVGFEADVEVEAEVEVETGKRPRLRGIRRFLLGFVFLPFRAFDDPMTGI